MATDITAWTTIGINLQTADQNPVTVTDTGAVAVSTGDAIHGTGVQKWSLANSGTISSVGPGSAIVFEGGGSVVNDGVILASKGADATARYGILIYGRPGSVTNRGSITAAGPYAAAVYVWNGGKVSNAPGAAISGGIYMDNDDVVVNSGTITGGSGSAFAIQINSGLIDNRSQGTIYGSIQLYSGTLVNSGSIASTYIDAVRNHWFGHLENSGTITQTGADYFGVRFDMGDTIVNSGMISGWKGGVQVDSGDIVKNSGIITGTGVDAVGVSMVQGCTLVNSGTIAATGTADAVSLSGTGNLLILQPGAVFKGIVQASSRPTHRKEVEAHNRLELGAGPHAGTLTGLGTEFRHFSDMVVDPQARWTVAGQNEVPSGGLINNGILTLADATLFGGPIINAATIQCTGSISTVADVITSSGAVVAQTGRVEFLRGGSFAGVLGGAGEIVLRGGDAYTLGPSLQLSVGSLQISGDGTSAELAGRLKASGSFVLGSAAELRLGPYDAALNGGATLHGTVSGNGVVTLGGASEVGGLTLSDDAAIRNVGSTVQTGDLVLGAADRAGAALSVQLGATYDLQRNSNIIALGRAHIANAGMFEKSAGNGLSQVAPDVVNTGTISLSAGSLRFLGHMANQQVITTNAGTLFIDGGISGGGTIDISSRGAVSLAGAAAAAQSVDFSSATGRLDLASPELFHSTIADFRAGDTIDLLNMQATQLAFANQTLTLSDGAGRVAHLKFAGSYTQSDFTTASDGVGGTLLLHT